MFFFEKNLLPSGKRKTGRILVDKFHSKWERTDTLYDTDWYGGESGYNYYCIAEYLDHFYKFERNLDGPLSAEKLKTCDILMLKNPTDPYSQQELDTIKAFVEQGGGLFLLGEHTDIFGTSTFLNPVAEPFGMAFRPDAVFDIERKWEQVYFTNGACPHPIMQGIPFYRFAVTCSIDSRAWNVRPVMRGTGLWNLPIEYASNNFYPPVEDKTYAKFGAFDQVTSVRFGRGRVVAYSDSTVYSNFLAFYPGRPEFLLKTIEWLNRTNRFSWVSHAGLIVFIGGVLAVLVLAFGFKLKPNPGFAVTLIVCAAASSWLSIELFSSAAKEQYPHPEPKKELHEIVFDMEHSTCELPVFGFTQERTESYEVFFQWVLRCGFFPKVSFTLEKALASGEPVVMVNPDPKQPLSEEERAPVIDYLENGGRLLVLKSAEKKPEAADPLLKPYELSFRGETDVTATVVEPKSGASICSLARFCSVQGGTSLLQTATGKTVVASQKVGKGLIVASGIANRFVTTSMGYSTRGVPDAAMRAVYELQFSLLRGLVSGEIEKEIESLGRLYSKKE